MGHKGFKTIGIAAAMADSVVILHISQRLTSRVIPKLHTHTVNKNKTVLGLSALLFPSSLSSFVRVILRAAIFGAMVTQTFDMNGIFHGQRLINTAYFA